MSIPNRGYNALCQQVLCFGEDFKALYIKDNKEQKGGSCRGQPV